MTTNTAQNQKLMTNSDDISDLERQSSCITDYVMVPSADHVSEIVGRRGYKIKNLRAQTNTYIKTPNRHMKPIFMISGTIWGVERAKRQIMRDSLIFTAMQMRRGNIQDESLQNTNKTDKFSKMSFDKKLESYVKECDKCEKPSDSGHFSSPTLKFDSDSDHDEFEYQESSNRQKNIFDSNHHSANYCIRENARGKTWSTETYDDSNRKPFTPYCKNDESLPNKLHELNDIINKNSTISSSYDKLNCLSKIANPSILYPNSSYHLVYCICQVRVPYNIVGLLVGPKGVTIKEIQNLSGCYIVTPNRNRDPVFEIFGYISNIQVVLRLIHSFLDSNLSNAERNSIKHIQIHCIPSPTHPIVPNSTLPHRNYNFDEKNQQIFINKLSSISGGLCALEFDQYNTNISSNYGFNGEFDVKNIKLNNFVINNQQQQQNDDNFMNIIEQRKFSLENYQNESLINHISDFKSNFSLHDIVKRFSIFDDDTTEENDVENNENFYDNCQIKQNHDVKDFLEDYHYKYDYNYNNSDDNDDMMVNSLRNMMSTIGIFGADPEKFRNSCESENNVKLDNL